MSVLLAGRLSDDLATCILRKLNAYISQDGC